MNSTPESSRKQEQNKQTSTEVDVSVKTKRIVIEIVKLGLLGGVTIVAETVYDRFINLSLVRQVDISLSLAFAVLMLIVIRLVSTFLEAEKEVKVEEMEKAEISDFFLSSITNVKAKVEKEEIKNFVSSCFESVHEKNLEDKILEKEKEIARLEEKIAEQTLFDKEDILDIAKEYEFDEENVCVAWKASKSSEERIQEWEISTDIEEIQMKLEKAYSEKEEILKALSNCKNHQSKNHIQYVVPTSIQICKLEKKQQNSEKEERESNEDAVIDDPKLYIEKEKATALIDLVQDAHMKLDEAEEVFDEEIENLENLETRKEAIESAIENVKKQKRSLQRKKKKMKKMGKEVFKIGEMLKHLKKSTRKTSIPFRKKLKNMKRTTARSMKHLKREIKELIIQTQANAEREEAVFGILEQLEEEILIAKEAVEHAEYHLGECQRKAKKMDSMETKHMNNILRIIEKKKDRSIKRPKRKKMQKLKFFLKGTDNSKSQIHHF